MRLIALLVVVLIMGVLAVMALPDDGSGSGDPNETILCLEADGGAYDSSREKGCRPGDVVLGPI